MGDNPVEPGEGFMDLSRSGRQALPPILDRTELLRPWKLVSLAVGVALMLVGSIHYQISDWDLGISVIMPLLTYLTSPWVVRVIAGLHFRYLLLALFWSWFTIDGVYWFYHTHVGNELLRWENLLTSTPIYLGMGCFWLPRASLHEILALLRGGQAVLPTASEFPSSRPLGLLSTLLSFAGVVLLWAGLVEPYWIEVRTHQLGASRLGQVPIRVVQLSDLHLSRSGWRETLVLRRLVLLKPDLIVLTGDILDRAEDLPLAEQFFAALPAVPRYAVLGNWEAMSGVDRSELLIRAGLSGVSYLINESTLVQTAAGKLRLTGLDDDFTGNPDWTRATRGIDADERLPHLVLQHSPAYREVLNRLLTEERQRRPLAMLAGHTHGGQLDFFGWQLLRPPGSGPYTAGWYREGGGRHAIPMYVSRGIGVSVLPVRFGVRPEIAVFEVAP